MLILPLLSMLLLMLLLLLPCLVLLLPTQKELYRLFLQASQTEDRET